MTDASFFDGLPVDAVRKAALQQLPETDQQVFKRWLGRVVEQQIDALLQASVRGVTMAVGGLKPCQPVDQDQVAQFRAAWLGTGSPAASSAFFLIAERIGLSPAVAERLVRRWVRDAEHAERHHLLTALVKGGAKDWQLYEWLGAKKGEIRQIRNETGVIDLSGSEKPTEEGEHNLFRLWENAAYKKDVETLLALHSASGIPIWRIAGYLSDWEQVRRKLKRVAHDR